MPGCMSTRNIALVGGGGGGAGGGSVRSRSRALHINLMLLDCDATGLDIGDVDHGQRPDLSQRRVNAVDRRCCWHAGIVDWWCWRSRVLKFDRRRRVWSRLDVWQRRCGACHLTLCVRCCTMMKRSLIAQLLYGARIGRNAHVLPQTLVMKAEALTSNRVYTGACVLLLCV